MDDQSTVTSRTSCAGRPVANPRRLRLGRDGQPLPVPAASVREHDEDHHAA